MRIMLLSANTGEGHNSSGKAIMEVLQKEKVTCEMWDCLSLLSPTFSKFISEWHSRIYQFGGKIYDKGYRFMEQKVNPEHPDNYNALYELFSIGAGKLRDALMEGQYDCVVCVHPFAGIMVTEVRRSWGLEVPTVMVATDYTCSPTVELSALDQYVVPAPEVCGQFSGVGIGEDRQFVCGIPVRQAFYEPADRETARTSLQIPLGSVTVLVMCGSMGCGPIQKIVKETLSQMPDDGVMIALCGRNEKLKEEMEEIADPRLRVMGYINNFPTYLDAADLIVTKPGGLSSTESANKHVPMVLINTVGGCENHNFDHFLKKGYAVGSKDAEEVVRMAIRMVWDREGRERMRKNLQRDFSQNTARQIVSRILELSDKYRKSMMLDEP